MMIYQRWNWPRCSPYNSAWVTPLLPEPQRGTCFHADPSPFYTMTAVLVICLLVPILLCTCFSPPPFLLISLYRGNDLLPSFELSRTELLFSLHLDHYWGLHSLSHLLGAFAPVLNISYSLLDWIGLILYDNSHQSVRVVPIVLIFLKQPGPATKAKKMISTYWMSTFIIYHFCRSFLFSGLSRICSFPLVPT